MLGHSRLTRNGAGKEWQSAGWAPTYRDGRDTLRHTAYRRWGKRAVDLVAAAILLVVLSPLMLLAACLCRCFMGSPVLYRQHRPFVLTKFRTMISDSTDAQGRPLADADRLPPFGALLRSLSIDELPQLLNVVRGEMSLVGPRPLLMQYLDRYTPEQMRRHDVIPGITGLAQISGRNALSWSERFRIDVWYVDHCSFALDARILIVTVWRALRREGITQSGHATVEEFVGSDV